MSNAYALIKGVDANGNRKSDVEHIVYGNIHIDIGPAIDNWVKENSGKKYIYTGSHKLAMIIDGDDIIQLGDAPDSAGNYDMETLLLINAYQFHIMTKGFTTHKTVGSVDTSITYTPATISASGDITDNN